MGTRWISVDERLPEPLKTVIVYCEPILTHDKNIHSFFEVTAYNKLANEWCMQPRFPHKITHWHPLPEPPESS